VGGFTDLAVTSSSVSRGGIPGRADQRMPEQPDLRCPIRMVAAIGAFQQVVNHGALKSRAHVSACLRGHSLQERASTTKGSTRLDALEVPDRTQKNQGDADSVQPVDQLPGMAAKHANPKKPSSIPGKTVILPAAQRAISSEP
jgi:hypothetical protein